MLIRCYGGGVTDPGDDDPIMDRHLCPSDRASSISGAVAHDSPLNGKITHIDRSEPAGWDRELIPGTKCDKRKSHYMPTVIVRIFTRRMFP